MLDDHAPATICMTTNIGTYGPADALEGDLDIAAAAASIPDGFFAKGMFHSRLKSKVGTGWSELEPQLQAAPRLGHYVPFNDYPLGDFFRLAGAAAARVHPRIGMREALRRIAREDFEVLTASTFGRVVLSAAGDARRALLATPTLYLKMVRGDWDCCVAATAPQAVRIDFIRNHGPWEYQLGQVEGLIMSYENTPRITVSLPEPLHVRFDVQWA
jgi:uncharacterized protein (TIGR02265 family)